MAAPIYYGQRAYEGFAKAFASRHGVAISVSGNSNGAYVDANGTITLPGINGYQAQSEFETTCAIVIHEIAHVVYGSHSLFERYKGAKPRLWMDCLNAVLDIADETAIEVHESKYGNARAGQLLVRSNVECSEQPGLLHTNHKNRDRSAPAHWRILATGIIKTRCIGKGVKGITRFGAWLETEFPAIDIEQVMSIFLRCRGRPIGTRWTNNLLNNTEKLYDLLKSVAPTAGSGDTPMPGGAGCPSQGGKAVAMARGVPNLPGGAQEATEAQGQAIAGNIAPCKPGNQPGGGAGHGPGTANQPVTMDHGCFDTMLPIVKRIASRFATDGEAINNEGGYSAGMGVRDAYRVATDGACMGRWLMDEHSDGMAVAVLLDKSGSMVSPVDILSPSAGIAEAFARGMEECAVVNRWSFSSEVSEHETFAHIQSDYGGTNTTAAIYAARKWMAEQTAGRKVIVCITDGKPNGGCACAEQVTQAISEGISVIGVALGNSDVAQGIYRSMPMATIVHAEDTNRLAIALEGITLQM